MANIVYMARSAWTGLLDTIRSKASVSGTMTVSQAATTVENIPSGGGSEFAQYVQGTISIASSDSVEYIRANAFASISSLKSVSFPNCSGMGTGAFSGCSQLRSVYIPNVKSIPQSAFAYCGSLLSAVFSSAISISAAAFASCKSLSYASFLTATSVSNSAFYYCYSLSSIYFPELTYIGANAFYYNAFSSVDLPKVSYVGASAFGSCYKLSMASLMSVTDISSAAFSNCPSLHTLKLSGELSMIRSAAFYKCTRLMSLYLYCSSVPVLSGLSHFTSTPIGGYSAVAGDYGSIFVLSSLYNDYISAGMWSNYSSRIASITE